MKKIIWSLTLALTLINISAEETKKEPATKSTASAKSKKNNSGKQKIKNSSGKKQSGSTQGKKTKDAPINKNVSSETKGSSTVEKKLIAQEVRADNVYDTLADTRSEHKREIYKTQKQQKGLEDIFNAFSASGDSEKNNDRANSIINREKNESNSNFVM